MCLTCYIFSSYCSQLQIMWLTVKWPLWRCCLILLRLWYAPGCRSLLVHSLSHILAPMMHLYDGALMWHSFKIEVERYKICFLHKLFLICNFHDLTSAIKWIHLVVLFSRERQIVAISTASTHLIIFKQPYFRVPEVQKRLVRSRVLWGYYIKNIAMKKSKACPSCHTWSHHKILKNLTSSI